MRPLFILTSPSCAPSALWPLLPTGQPPSLPCAAHTLAGTQDLALLDLALLAEEVNPKTAWRRVALFADETGKAGWTPVATALLSELGDFVRALSAALPTVAADAAAKAAAAGGGGSSRGGAADTASAAAQHVQWNAVKAVAGAAKKAASKGGGASKQQVLAAWHVQSRLHRTAWCLRALAALLCASFKEDRYGVVQLCEPSLPTVLAALLSARLVLQQYARYVGSAAGQQQHHHQAPSASLLAGALSRLLLPRPPRALPPPPEAAARLEDVSKTCLYRVSSTFGPTSLLRVLQELKGAPLFGSASELSATLRGFLAHQE